MKLHPYQRKGVNKIKALLSDGERPLAYAPTGAGKTVIAAEVFAQVGGTGLKVFIVHTDQLRTQAQAVLSPHGVVVVTIQTLLLRPDVFAEAVLVCFDECHHLRGKRWREAVRVFKQDCAMFGLSATPFPCEMDELFTQRTSIARIEHLLEGRYILPVSIVHPSDPALAALSHNDRIDGALAYAARGQGRQAVHFEPTIELCERVASIYEGLGIRHAVLTGKTPATVRDLQIARFRGKELQVLIAPVLLSEGFDAPCAEVLVAGRAFSSDVLLQQAVGRIRRTHPGKTQAFVLDCTGCCVGRPTDYFNRTDENLFGSLEGAEAEDREREGRPSVLGQVKRPAAFNWIEIPEDQWVTEQAPSVAETLARLENADAVAAVERMLADAKREKQREKSRRQLARKTPEQRRVTYKKAENARKAKEKADPSRRLKRLAAQAALSKTQDQGEKRRARHAARMLDPEYRERQRVKWREQKRREAASGKRPKRSREAAREYCRRARERVNADPVRREARLASMREYYRRRKAAKAVKVG